jgi:hypothetical protein
MTTFRLSNRINEKCGQKNNLKVVWKLKNETSWNEVFICEMDWNFPNTYTFINAWIFWSITCLGIFVGWFINIHDEKHRG